MTHFNHEWDATQTPAVPVATGDRYYAQDLNDDFNYLKHLPYEVFLQGRSRGVMIPPEDTWDNDNNQLTFSGGFGAILQDHICLDPDEDWSVPPKTKTSPRYERIPFTDVTLTLPNDGSTHYIVATPTKRSLLQRTKALLTSQYASRTKYDGIVTIQDTAPTAGQILVGLCHNKEYCLLIDNNPDQCKDNIILKKWFGQNKISTGLVSVLQSYYNTLIASITTKISIDIVSGVDGINGGNFNNCTITINTVTSSHVGIYNGTFNNCTINIDAVNGGSNCYGMYGGRFNRCDIAINTITSSKGISDTSSMFRDCTIAINTISTGGDGIAGGRFSNCTIMIGTVNSSSDGTYDGVFDRCSITITRANGGTGVNGAFRNCYIYIHSVGTTTSTSYGIYRGDFINCTISINTVAVNSIPINNSNNVRLCLTFIDRYGMEISSLSSTNGKLNVLNNSVLHTS